MMTTEGTFEGTPGFLPVLGRVIVRLGGKEIRLKIGESCAYVKHGTFLVTYIGERAAMIVHTTLSGKKHEIYLSPGWTHISNGRWEFTTCEYESFIAEELVERILELSPDFQSLALQKLTWGMKVPKVKLPQLTLVFPAGQKDPATRRTFAMLVDKQTLTVPSPFPIPGSGQSTDMAFQTARAFRDREERFIAVVYQSDGRALAAFFEGVKIA